MPKLTTSADEQIAFQKCLRSKNPWEAARKIPMTRVYQDQVEKIEPGVKFFILALNSLGLETHFSCEGHPKGFYVTFKAPYKTALKINQQGYFEVEILGTNYWALRRTRNDQHQTTELDKNRALAWAAVAWIKGIPLLAQEKTLTTKTRTT